jgi:large subunit ribosomal protein L29
MKIAELRAKGKEELKDLVLTLKKEQFNLRMQDATGALETKGRIKEVRRTIARAKTLMNEDPSKIRPKADKGDKVAKKPAAKKPAAKSKKG